MPKSPQIERVEKRWLWVRGEVGKSPDLGCKIKLTLRSEGQMLGSDMSTKGHHVVTNLKGGWSVKRSGAERASKTFSNQTEAVSYARDIARRTRGELYIHGRDGRIRERNSYGSDSFPPKG